MPVRNQDPVALISYSTKSRGGVNHTLSLGEALHARGYPVLVVGLGDQAAGFFRPAAVPTLIVQAPAVPPGDGSKAASKEAKAAAMEAKVDANIDALESALTDVARRFPILHTQDCIAARAAARVRDAGARTTVVRTVHHVDDFDTAKLMDCQRQAILEPDHVLVVSRMWQQILAADYGVHPELVGNGVDLGRFESADPGLARELRQRVAPAAPLVLSVGGMEPRKGTDTLVRALAQLRRDGTAAGAPSPVLAIIGGHSFQDHNWYRDKVLADLPGLGLAVGRDVIELGTVPDAEMAAWYKAADVLAFPSVKEGFGLAPLEAMAVGTPVVVSDLPVFGEWLQAGRDALCAPVGDDAALASALRRVLTEPRLAARLRAAGHAVAAQHGWDAVAAEHQQLYQRFGALAAR